MMLGVELVTDRKQKTPARTEISHAMDQMKGDTFLHSLHAVVSYNSHDS